MEYKVEHFMKYCLCVVVLKYPNYVSGTKQYLYSLTGSSQFAVLGEDFTWTCGNVTFPPGVTKKPIVFNRNDTLCAGVGYVNKECVVQITNPSYRYNCVSDSQYTVTIPAENMTETEQGLAWNCEILGGMYGSLEEILTIAIDVYNVSLIPRDNQLTIKEGTQRAVLCIVNSNAVPAPTITWYLESTDITSIAGANTTSIIITGNRTDNAKMLQCRATNNNKIPKTANTKLNVEYPPTVKNLPQQMIIEGENLSVTCQVTPGNPNSTTFYWTKLDDPASRQKKQTLQLPNIPRNRSGTYRCTAENSYSTGGNGTHSQTMLVDVLYPPTVKTLSNQKIIEGGNLSVICEATLGNPNSTTFYWTKVDSAASKQIGPSLQLLNIQRNSSGTYKCTAENNYSIGGKGKHSETMLVDVLYPPTVNTLSQVNITEGGNLSVTCQSNPGNPNTTTFYWTKVDNERFRQNGTTLQLNNIQKTSSGIYMCTAENNYYEGMKGTSYQTMNINVLYHPIIEGKLHQIINESDIVSLSLTITSNPLSNVTWYDNNKKLSTQEELVSEMFSQKIISTFNKATAECTDTKNFTVVISNGIGQIVEALVELIVNCKPKPDKKNITLGVTDQSGIEFSTTIIGYPEPCYDLKNENGSTNVMMKDTLTRNAVNNFTIHFNQTIVSQNDYGSYFLTIYNTFGKTIVMVNVIPQRRPDKPRNVEITCEETRAKVQWISSFNGGDRQNFTVTAFSGQYGMSFSNPTTDEGENIIHVKYIENLRSSTEYVFYVSAQNQHGIRLSENITCKTLEKGSNINMPIIAGGAAAGGIVFAFAIIIVVILLRKYIKIEKSAKHTERLNNVSENENDEADVDGLKENSLYVSAGPKDDERSEVAVYAAVAKKQSQSDNNSNLYADVKKSGRKEKKTLSSDDKTKKGLFKKDEKAKHKKGKKPKNRPGEIDVYENSEDIALSTNTENVYSNAGQKGPNKQKERGYKNKDGLLYVEVNFDGKQGHDNPVIHGEDEKTDYATVEFPMPSSVHKASGGEEL